MRADRRVGRFRFLPAARAGIIGAPLAGTSELAANSAPGPALGLKDVGFGRKGPGGRREDEAKCATGRAGFGGAGGGAGRLERALRAAGRGSGVPRRLHDRLRGREHPLGQARRRPPHHGGDDDDGALPRRGGVGPRHLRCGYRVRERDQRHPHRAGVRGVGGRGNPSRGPGEPQAVRPHPGQGAGSLRGDGGEAQGRRRCEAGRGARHHRAHRRARSGGSRRGDRAGQPLPRGGRGHDVSRTRSSPRRSSRPSPGRCRDRR